MDPGETGRAGALRVSVRHEVLTPDAWFPGLAVRVGPPGPRPAALPGTVSAVPGVVDAGERGTEDGFGLGVVLTVAGHWSVVRTSWGKRITVLLPLSC
ncbi:hypothetical protein ACIQVA_36235 [Streptomyces microflavus]|uniref:hypothetical protein n=1 Tax=Streptomyces microflavus TaxID=1919 RepID=UPI003822CF12